MLRTPVTLPFAMMRVLYRDVVGFIAMSHRPLQRKSGGHTPQNRDQSRASVGITSDAKSCNERSASLSAIVPRNKYVRR